MATLQKITPNLWFNGQAETAINFYASVFKNSRIGRISRYGTEGFEFHGQPEGTAMTVEFQLEGQLFLALNGGPQFKFSEAISFIVNCETQEEVDYYWDKLTDGGDPSSQVCGWLKDKFGLSWQIVPTAVGAMMSDPDAQRSQRVMHSLFQMKKIDIKTLEKAYRE